jgi:type I restriction enzyme S subunit
MGKGIYPPSVQPGIPRLDKTPDGWKKVTFGDILTDVQRPVKLVDNKEYQLVVAKRSRGGIEPRERLMGKKVLTKTQFEIKAHDFLISNRQIVHGACGIVPANLDGAVVSNEYSVLHSKSDLDLIFLNHFTNSIFFQQTCFHASVGVDVEKMIFRIDEWFKRELNLPPLAEQKKIAEILSTWDKAIEQANSFISLKEKTKAKIGKEILSGERRLSGFAMPWSKRKLSELGECIRGLTYSPDNVRDSGLLVLRSSNVQNARLCLKDSVYVNLDVAAPYLSQTGDILVCVRNGSRSLIGKTALIKEGVPKATHGAFMSVFRTQHSEYVFQLFQTQMYYDQVSKNLGATINSINNNDLLKFVFPFPSDEEEIKAISSTLGSIDSEISALKDLVDLYQKQKQGLMQKLLTGKLRVKV